MTTHAWLLVLTLTTKPMNKSLAQMNKSPNEVSATMKRSTVMQREDRLNTTLQPRDRRTLPSRQRTYRRLGARVDRLEDAISHFYNVINELRTRVSTLEKKVNEREAQGS